MQEREANQWVVDSAGVGGRVVADVGPGELRVHLDDGSVVELDEDLLRPRSDGSREIPGRWMELANTLSLPRVEERVEIGKRPVVRGRVVLTKRVQEEDVTLHELGVEEEVEIEHVPVNRYVDSHPDVRTQGDTMIIPCVEEVIVVEKRLRVREEIHVRRVRREVDHPITVKVRREDIDVERRAAGEVADDEERKSNNNQGRPEEESS
jgi:stress response protein YsnF